MKRRRRRGHVPISAIQWLETKEEEDPPGFSVRDVSPAVGKGLFAEKHFSAGDFLVEYRGNLVDASHFDDADDCSLTYVYYFHHGAKRFCLDATLCECAAKYANDEWREPNGKVVKEVVAGIPRLLLVARRDIQPEEEIRYDYGNKDALWRKQECKKSGNPPDIKINPNIQNETEDTNLKAGSPNLDIPPMSDMDSSNSTRGSQTNGNPSLNISPPAQKATCPDSSASHERQECQQIGNLPDINPNIQNETQDTNLKAGSPNLDIPPMSYMDSSNSTRGSQTNGNPSLNISPPAQKATCPDSSASHKRQECQQIGNPPDINPNTQNETQDTNLKAGSPNLDIPPMSDMDSSNSTRGSQTNGNPSLNISPPAQKATCPDSSASHKRQECQQIGNPPDINPNIQNETQDTNLKAGSPNLDIPPISDMDSSNSTRGSQTNGNPSLNISPPAQKATCPDSSASHKRDLFRICIDDYVPESPQKNLTSSVICLPSTSQRYRSHPHFNFRPRVPTSKVIGDDSSDTSSESSGSEYKCDSESSETSEVFDLDVDKDMTNLNVDKDDTSSQSITNEKVIANDNANITVPTTNNDGKRTWDKRDMCVFCGEGKTKLVTHLEAKHKDEVEVIDWMNEKDKTIKLQKLRKLRNVGNYKHNCQVLREGQGELVVSYRPSPSEVPPSATDYGPCPTCFAFLVKREMWKHKCPEKQQSETRRRKVLEHSKMLVPNSSRNEVTSSHLRRILSSMKSDEVARCVKSDSLIIEMAEKESFKLGHNDEQDNYIRGKLRELGRLLLQFRKTSGCDSACLQDFIYPDKYQMVVESVHVLCGFDGSSHTFTNPSLAIKSGHTLKKVATLIKGHALESGDDALYRRATGFCELCEMNWTEDVSRHAHRTLYDNKRNNPQLLPLTSDIACLAAYTKNSAKENMALLKQNAQTPKLKAWTDLAEVTLAQVITFNRRRQGEASKLKLEDYKVKCRTGGKETALHETLTKFEKELCRSLSRVEIVGKRGNTVPIILTREVKVQIDLLVETRNKVGVSNENKYVFARANNGSLGHIRGSDCLRDLSLKCGATKPECLRSTRLRKHIATVSQILHLDDNELEVLAKFMGHDIKTHREYYRLPDETMQLAKISKFLINLEKPGSLATLTGKSWKDMQVTSSEEIEATSDISDMDEDEFAEPEQMLGSEPEAESVEPVRSPAAASNTVSEADSTCTGEEGTSAKKDKRRRWTSDEKAAIEQHFSRMLIAGNLPGKLDILKVMQKEPVLQRRSWRNIKDYCRNLMVSKARKQKR